MPEQMPGQTIEELLVEWSDPPVTEEEYRARRAVLVAKFDAQHSLATWEAIEHAIRTHAIEETILVEEWIELRAISDVFDRARS